jgi:hypothetical protein
MTISKFLWWQRWNKYKKFGCFRNNKFVAKVAPEKFDGSGKI